MRMYQLGRIAKVLPRNCQSEGELKNPDKTKLYKNKLRCFDMIAIKAYSSKTWAMEYQSEIAQFQSPFIIG